jgi:hypothetical protein
MKGDIAACLHQPYLPRDCDQIHYMMSNEETTEEGKVRAYLTCPMMVPKVDMCGFAHYTSTDPATLAVEWKDKCDTCGMFCGHEGSAEGCDHVYHNKLLKLKNIFANEGALEQDREGNWNVSDILARNLNKYAALNMHLNSEAKKEKFVGKWRTIIDEMKGARNPGEGSPASTTLVGHSSLDTDTESGDHHFKEQQQKEDEEELPLSVQEARVQQVRGFESSGYITRQEIWHQVRRLIERDPTKKLGLTALGLELKNFFGKEYLTHECPGQNLTKVLKSHPEHHFNLFSIGRSPMIPFVGLNCVLSSIWESVHDFIIRCMMDGTGTDLLLTLVSVHLAKQFQPNYLKRIHHKTLTSALSCHPLNLFVIYKAPQVSYVPRR